MVTLIGTILLSLGTAQAAGYASTHSVDSLIESSDDVVVGRVESLTATTLESGLIETEVQVLIDDAHDRLNRRAVSFWLPGGQVGETTLTVPGTPRVVEGDEVMVFLDQGKPVGLGQGVWTTADGGFTAASAGHGEALRIDPAAVMGDVDTVQDCLDSHQAVAVEDGWSLRARMNQGNREGTARGIAISLLGGLEYRLTVCGDGLAAGAWAQVISPSNELVGEALVEKQGVSIGLKPSETGLYTVVVGAEGIDEGVWRTRFGIGLAYR